MLPTRLDVPMAPPTEEKPRGSIGVGSWHTQVEYTDIAVTASDGGKLLAANQARDMKVWQFSGGDWNLRDDAITPAARDAETWAFAGDRNWSDYTISLRARKVRGREGFIVIWHAADADKYHWWNIGGWDNTLARCEASNGGGREPYGTGTPLSVETGRWYDLRLEVSGLRARGFVDGKLVTDATYVPRATAAAVFATATYDKANRTVIVKVVNAGSTPVATNVNLRGVSSVEPTGTALVLAGDPTAVNTLDEPRRVAPKRETVTQTSASFRHTFPAHSLTILRLKTSPNSHEARGAVRNPILRSLTNPTLVFRQGSTRRFRLR